MSVTLPERESLTIEFKSDARRLSDEELVLAVVCLANTDGGSLFLGVEDDGRITGLHPDHLEVSRFAPLIANKTQPSVSVTVERLVVEGVLIARVDVPRMGAPVATSRGTLQRRRLKQDGTPECTPLYPHEILSRQARLGELDPSALPVAGATVADLDPAERARLRATLQRSGGDGPLAELADDELDAALRLTVREGDRIQPTVAGLLLIGREEPLARLLPTHETAFQLLEGTEVRLNLTSRAPILRALEDAFTRFEGIIREEEVEDGLLRISVPTLDRRALREALVNAYAHRDYARLGPVRIVWDDEGLAVSNPGGFVEGVTLDNLLRTEPRPRNPSLADALKRIGLAERTGRGVDLIFSSLLRFGRPPPDYSESDATLVKLRLSSTRADLPFLRLVLEHEQRTGLRMPVDSLIVLARLRDEKRLALSELQHSLQRPSESSARAVVEGLVESGLVEAHGTGKGRAYTLGASAYQKMGRAAEYVRQAGVPPERHAELVRTWVRNHGQIRRAEVVALCGIAPWEATRLLNRLVKEKALQKRGSKRGTAYSAGPNL